MTQKSSILCPNCKNLISSYVDQCPHCGLKNPARKNSFFRLIGANQRSFVKTIIAVNIIFFVVSLSLPFFLPLRGKPISFSFGILPSPNNQALALLGWAELSLFLRGDWWILVTAMFLHGGVLHILFNMLWFRELAPQTEILFSPHKMLIIYIISGMGGNLAAMYTPVLARSLLSISMTNYPVVGASGAVFGLIGAIMAFGRKRGGIWGKQVVRQLGTWAVILIAMGFIFPGISNAGHIGGFISGFIIGQLIPLRSSSGSNTVYMVMGTGVLVLCGYSFYQMVMRLMYIVSQI